MGRRATEILLSDEERAELQRWLRRRSGRAGLYVRAGIVLDCAAGRSGKEIAEHHRVSLQTKFAGGRLAGKGALQSFLKSHPKWPSFFKTLTMDTDRSFLKVVDAEFKFLRDDTTVGD